MVLNIESKGLWVLVVTALAWSQAVANSRNKNETDELDPAMAWMGMYVLRRFL
jgi:hypothetical protein